MRDRPLICPRLLRILTEAHESQRQLPGMRVISRQTGLSRPRIAAQLAALRAEGRLDLRRSGPWRYVVRWCPPDPSE